MHGSLERVHHLDHGSKRRIVFSQKLLIELDTHFVDHQCMLIQHAGHIITLAVDLVDCIADLPKGLHDLGMPGSSSRKHTAPSQHRIGGASCRRPAADQAKDRTCRRISESAYNPLDRLHILRGQVPARLLQ